MHKSVQNSPLMIGSRDQDRAANFAKGQKVPEHGTYTEVLAHPNIDAIYIPLPNHLHFAWAKKAIESGKHVLVDKPIVLKSDELRELIYLAQEHGVSIMEGFMYRFQPVVSKIKGIVEQQQLGRIINARFVFAHQMIDYLDAEDNYRYYKEMGGGAMWDLGCYGVNFFQLLFGQPGEIMDASSQQITKKKKPELTPADLNARLLLGFGTTEAEVLAGFNYFGRHVWLSGERGELYVEDIISDQDKQVRVTTFEEGKNEIIHDIDGIDGYLAEIDAFSTAVTQDKVVPVSNQSSLDTLQIVEDFYQLVDSSD